MTTPTKQPSAEMIAAWENEADLAKEDLKATLPALINRGTKARICSGFKRGYLAAKAADHAEMEKHKLAHEISFRERKELMRDMDRLSKSYNFDQQMIKDLQQENERIRAQIEKAEGVIRFYAGKETGEDAADNYFQSKAEKETK